MALTIHAKKNNLGTSGSPYSVAALVPSALRAGSYELFLRSGSKDGQVFEGRLDERVRVIAAS